MDRMVVREEAAYLDASCRSAGSTLGAEPLSPWGLKILAAGGGSIEGWKRHKRGGRVWNTWC